MIDQTEWTLQDGILKPNVLYVNKLHSIKGGSTKLAELIQRYINPNDYIKKNEPMFFELFSCDIYFNLNQKNFLTLPCSVSFVILTVISIKQFRHRLVNLFLEMLALVQFFQVNPLGIETFLQINLLV